MVNELKINNVEYIKQLEKENELLKKRLYNKQVEIFFKVEEFTYKIDNLKKENEKLKQKNICLFNLCKV